MSPALRAKLHSHTNVQQMYSLLSLASFKKEKKRCENCGADIHLRVPEGGGLNTGSSLEKHSVCIQVKCMHVFKIHQRVGYWLYGV